MQHGLQAALGELTFESEAADRLRAELRAAQEQATDLQQQLQLSQHQVQAGQDTLRDVQQAAADASRGSEQQQRVERQLQVNKQCLLKTVLGWRQSAVTACL